MNPCQCLDYSVSWTYWRAHCWEVHGFDPGTVESPEKITNEIPVEPKWNSRQWDVIDSLRGEVLHLQKKVDALTKKRSVKNVL